jgi:hypothetical protein
VEINDNSLFIHGFTRESSLRGTPYSFLDNVLPVFGNSVRAIWFVLKYDYTIT